MVKIYYSAAGQARVKKTSLTSVFLSDQVLGLVSGLTEIFNMPPDLRSVMAEQKRSIKAMEELIRVGRKNIRVARPQVSCLCY